MIKQPTNDQIKTIVAVFKNAENDQKTSKLSIPISSNPEKLNKILETLSIPEDRDKTYSFFINDLELTENITDFATKNKTSLEGVIEITYDQKELFKVKPVTRCSSTLPGHKSSILVVSFSPDGKKLATGSGDKTVRLWDLSTELPLHVLEEHEHWVQAAEWSPNGKTLTTGCYGGFVCLWDGDSGKLLFKTHLHKKAVLGISWEPFIANENSEKFATAGMDSTVKIFNSKLKRVKLSLSGHTDVVTSVAWGGRGYIYSASRDKRIIVWNAKNGKLIRTLNRHSHWVNHISLSTSYALKFGYFACELAKKSSRESAPEKSLRIQTAKVNFKMAFARGGSRELLVSGSDDHTAFLWDPLNSSEPLCRLTGHQQAISFVKFSPNGRFISTVSFDKSLRVWEGKSGKLLKTFRGHVGAVFQVCWSPDSKFLVTGSKDSTLKLWSVLEMKRKADLPGHSDEVFAVDWSYYGDKVASGGRDGNLKLWRN